MYIEKSPKGTISRQIKISDFDIAYWERPAKGTQSGTLVFIHGNSASKSAFAKLYASDTLAHYRLFAFDMPGCGETNDAPKPVEQYTIPALAKFVMSFVKAMNIGQYVLVGWSLGGHIAIETLNLGALPKGLVLTGTPPCGPAIEEIATTFLPVPGAEVTSAESPTKEQLEAFIKTLYSPSDAPETMAKAAFRADGRLRSHLFAHFLSTQDMKLQRGTVAQTQVPIALIQGEQEPFFDPKLVDKLEYGNLWRGKTQWIAGTGHAPFLDKPEEYSQILVNFCESLLLSS